MRKDIGLTKVEVIKSYVENLYDHGKIHIEAVQDFIEAKNLDQLLAGCPDFVVDCIDDIDTKVDLLRYCHEKKLKVICSGGAGMRADPTKILIQDLSDTKDDRLTRAVRLKLKTFGIYSGIPVIYSNERTERDILPLMEHQEEDPDNFRPLEKMRVRIIPVLGTMPSVFGHAIACYV